VVERGTASRHGASASPWPARPAPPTTRPRRLVRGILADLAVGVYVGFDRPRNLGRRATGGGGLPIWVDFMQAASRGARHPLPHAARRQAVRIDAETGLLPGNGTQTIIAEAFLPGTEPAQRTTVPPCPRPAPRAATPPSRARLRAARPPASIEPACRLSTGIDPSS
jgi:penicillin-binding protein 1A